MEVTLAPTSASKLRTQVATVELEFTMDADGKPAVVKIRSLPQVIVGPIMQSVPWVAAESDLIETPDQKKARLEALAESEKMKRFAEMIVAADAIIPLAAIEPMFAEKGKVGDEAHADLDALNPADKLTLLNMVCEMSGVVVADKDAATFKTFRDGNKEGRKAGVDAGAAGADAPEPIGTGGD